MQLTPAHKSAELIRYDSHTHHPIALLVRTALPPGSLRTRLALGLPCLWSHSRDQFAFLDKNSSLVVGYTNSPHPSMQHTVLNRGEESSTITAVCCQVKPHSNALLHPPSHIVYHLQLQAMQIVSSLLFISQSKLGFFAKDTPRKAHLPISCYISPDAS